MRDIELEEGEAYFVPDDYENIDPDRDLSYIDKKIENVLGHYQKDFMGGISAETLGARFGGYGSFLPMQQRSPSALTGQRVHSNVSSKSPHNVRPEQPHTNPTSVTNNPLPVKPLSGSSANGKQAVSQSVTFPIDNQPKVKDASESAPNKQQKEPMPQYSKQNSLKFRVKMTDKNALPYDKSAIYSGLGLDISPSSSPEDSHSDTESPSYIVELMTTLPLFNGELLSPLHDSWVNLINKKNNVESSIPPYAQELVSNNSHGNNCFEGKKEGSNVKKPNVNDSNKDKKIKKEPNKGSSLKEEHQNVNTSSGRTRVNKNDMEKKNDNECIDKVNKGVLSKLGSSKQDNNVYRKGYEIGDTMSNDKEAGLFSMKDVNENDKHGDTYEEMKDRNTSTLSKQKTHVKVFGGKEKFCSKEPSRESLVVGPSGKEIRVGKSITPLKSKKGESELRKEVKKSYKAPTNAGSNKKGKEREISLSPTKKDEKLSFKKKETVAVVGPDNTSGLIGGNSVENMAPVVNLATTEIVPHDDWVQCDKCHKWRLLPLGVDPESLPKVWKCSMLTWMPGKNKCSVSEEETNAAYQPVGPTQLQQNGQLAYPDVGAFVGASGDLAHVGISSHTSNINGVASGSKRQDLMKTDLEASRRSGFRDSVHVKKDRVHSGEVGVRDLKKLARDPSVARKTGDVKPSKLEKKRESDFDASGVPKKSKRSHQPSISENDNYALAPLQIARDYGQTPVKSPHVKVKDKTQSSMIAKSSETRDSMKKRKLKDRDESTTSSGYHPDKVEQETKNIVNGKNNNDGGKRKLTSSSDNIYPKKGKYYGDADKGSSQRIISNVRISTEKPLDFRVSDNATTSSSSKVSVKGKKTKVSKVKCSPIGSISSSPFRVSKCDSDKGTSKMQFPTHEEDVREIKSNLSNSSRNKSAGKRPNITEDCKDGSFKLDDVMKASGAKSSNGVHVNECGITKVRDPTIGSHKEASHAHVQARAQLSHMESFVKKGSLDRDAKTALKEATNLKHSANRLKISGSTIESTEVFFQAALKFLHGASLLEPGNNESGRSGEMASTEVYSTTATLCEYCAREYERGNNLAFAALAYKCMEVAYMRVVYCNDVVASRDRIELQMAIRTVTQVESPSSSASDVDNLNNQVAIMDTMKDGHSSALDHRAHVISAENRPCFSRLLNFTEDINRAMEASRRSQIAFGGATPILTQGGKHVALSSIKTVLDFSFHDVQGFLPLVRLAMEALVSN